MTFPGVALPLSYVAAIVGPEPAPAPMIYLADPLGVGDSESVNGGTTFDALVYDDGSLPADPGGPVSISWVVITAAGSSGTLDLSSSMSGDPLQGVGSVAVSGEQEVVVPAAGVTQAALLAGGEARLRVAVAGDSVIIRQIKMRVWPAGGIRGSWVTTPSWTYEADPRSRRLSVASDVAPGDGTELDEAWEEAEGEARSRVTAKLEGSPYVYATNPGGPDLRYSRGSGDATGTDSVLGGAGATNQVALDILYVAPPTAEVITGLPDADLTRHPDMVEGEPGSYLRSTSGGPLVSTPTGWGEVALDIYVRTTGNRVDEAGEEWLPWTGAHAISTAIWPDLPAIELLEGTSQLVALGDNRMPLPEEHHEVSTYPEVLRGLATPDERFLIRVSGLEELGFANDGDARAIYVTPPNYPTSGPLTGPDNVKLYEGDNPVTSAVAGTEVTAYFVGSYTVTVPTGLRWVPGGEKWLRGVQRNDGLSHSTPRGVQVSSVQRSLRGVGYR